MIGVGTAKCLLNWDNNDCRSRSGPVSESISDADIAHVPVIDSVVFDERNLVSAGGLVPVLELAEQTGLSWLIGEHVDLPSSRVRSGAVNPAGKLTTIIAGMMCGADSIDDAKLLRAGGTPRVFDEVYAPSTTRPCPPPRPTLPTANTRSWRPPSPT